MDDDDDSALTGAKLIQSDAGEGNLAASRKALTPIWLKLIDQWQALREGYDMLDDKEDKKQAERRIWQQTALLLRVHHNYQLVLPVRVARWLRLQIDEMLAGNSVLGYQRQAQATTRTEAVKMFQRVAVEYITLAEQGAIEGTRIEAETFVMKTMNVSRRTLSEWKKLGPHGSLQEDLQISPVLSKDDRTIFAKERLKHVAELRRRDITVVKTDIRKEQRKHHRERQEKEELEGRLTPAKCAPKAG